MNVREEEEENRDKNSTGLVLGVAAAAVGVGVGVGAALYYFFKNSSTGPEPHTFRERSWTLEECSICCEVMLKGRDIRKLKCGHNFHGACIRPWLACHNTCPNCRKNTEQ